MNSQSRNAIGTSDGEDDAARPMPIGMSRSTSGSAVAAARARFEAAIAERDAADDRADDLEQGPDRGDADHAGAEEADVGPEHRARRPPRPRRATPRGQDRQQDPPADDQAERASPCRPRCRRDGRRRSARRKGRPTMPVAAGADMEEMRGLLGEQPGLGDQGEGGRGERAGDDQPAGPCGFSSPPSRDPAPTFSTSAAATPSG